MKWPQGRDWEGSPPPGGEGWLDWGAVVLLAAPGPDWLVDWLTDPARKLAWGTLWVLAGWTVLWALLVQLTLGKGKKRLKGC